MSITVSMPSNIALIKYMGKKKEGKNRATNPSVSYTLDHLKTTVTLEPVDGATSWQALPGDFPIALSEAGQTRFLNHLDFVRESLSIEKTPLLVKSGNNFPSDCGIASSASSFAALTEAVCQLSSKKIPTEEKAWLSAQGSGSSCRSFFSGWVLWDGDRVQTAETPFENLLHMVLLSSDQVKKVSSSEAHQRISSSFLNMERAHRAEKRLDLFAEIQSSKSWKDLYEMSWAEFWDMHALFETSRPPFGYMNSSSMVMLDGVRSHWEEHGDGPVATMDAGPNVHLLWREDQKKIALDFYHKRVMGKTPCLSNIQEIGFAKA